MKDNFFEAMEAIKNNQLESENGNVGYKTTDNALVDLNFRLPMYRDERTDNELIESLKLVLESSDKEYFLKYLFYVRDVRAGLGERRFFRVAMQYLISLDFENKEEILEKLIRKEIAEYGRFDDLLVFLDTKYEQQVFSMFREQLENDLANMKASKPISLLAKWMPSENTSSPKTIAKAKRLRKGLGMTSKEYRKTLSELRAYLKVVETLMSAKKWESIDYNTVPSNANVKYTDAFLRNDSERRIKYLEDLRTGKEGVKINSIVNYPHQIVAKYNDCRSWNSRVKSYDEALEQLWKGLPDLEGLDDTIVTRDGSGSMTVTLPGSTGTTALDVSTALSIYCAERLKGAMKNCFITFSHRAELIKLPGTSLHDNLEACYQENDCSNTDILNVFRLILNTAKQNKMSQEELPKQVLIVSDMEFDGAGFHASGNVFEVIKEEYKAAGYSVPKLVFWNVNSRTGSIPAVENENGVLLISGFSVNLIELVLSGKNNTHEALIEKLNSERYKDIPLLSF